MRLDSILYLQIVVAITIGLFHPAVSDIELIWWCFVALVATIVVGKVCND